MRDTLLADLVRRQPLLAAINIAVALLFASALLGAAPGPELAAWFAYVALAQTVRLALWRRYAAGRLARGAAGWLVATSAAAGLGWGLIGPLFAGLGSPAQQALVPFFLAGMAGGAVTALPGHPPAFYAFVVPALLPYAARLGLTAEPAMQTMGLVTLLYAASIAAVGHQVHGLLRRSAELGSENAGLIADLERARRDLERLAERRGAELEAVLATVPVAVWVVHDPEARRITGSRRAAEMLRLGPGDNQSLTAPEGERPRHFRVLKDGREVPTEELPLQRAARGATVRDEELRVVFDDSSFLDELISAAPVRDAAGRVTGAVGAAVDITERKRAEERIRHMAHHDALTGLPNRALLQDRLRQALAQARRGGVQVALLLLDLDGFKDVNDTLGHPAGDRLLRLAAERLAAVVRAGDTLARLGGDEFAVVLPGLDAPEGAAALARRLLDALAAPFALAGQEVHVAASVGVAVCPADGDDADELVRRADLALYRAKREGRGRVRFFEPGMDEEAQARLGLERELRRGLERGEFALAYQPQLDLRTGRVTGVEGLARWAHPERGLVPPGEFVPVAEASGLIVPLGAWVLDEACRQAAAWRRDADLVLTVAVNVSPAQLRHPELLATVDKALAASGLEPGGLELEVTEGLLVELSAAAGGCLAGLAARGVGLAIDDFGTGYSSLAYLKRLPARKIKVDRSFVRDIGTDPEDEAVVRAIVTLGHALGKEVVAEGVETETQLAFLRALGCDAAQGFLLGRPVAAADLALERPELGAASRRTDRVRVIPARS